MSNLNRSRDGGCFAVAGLVFLLAGCGGDDGGGGRVQSSTTIERGARIDSIPLLTIGDDPEDPLYQVIGAVLVGDTLIVAQASSMTLRFYDRRTGEFLRSVGGRGEGPGEYEGLVSPQRAGDKLYTYDLQAYRMTVLDLSGTLVRTVSIEPWGVYNFPYLAGVFPDGSLLVSAQFRDWANTAKSPMLRRDVSVLGRYDANGVFLDSLGSYLGGEYYVAPYGNGGETMRGGIPFVRRSAVGVLGDGYYILDNKEPRIPVFDTVGNLLHEVGPDIVPEPVRITAEDREGFSDLDDIDSDDLPQFYPFYSRGAAVGGALWLLHYGDLERDGRREWSVYSHEGDPIGRVTSSERNLPTILGHEAHGFREVFPEGRIHRPNPYPLR